MYINPWIIPFMTGDPTTIFLAILLWVMTIIFTFEIGMCFKIILTSEN